ncbi:MAG: DUF4923 family protein [Prevotella sp.]|nr:DUF4923 family protein [Prevotella sp.]
MKKIITKIALVSAFLFGATGTHAQSLGDILKGVSESGSSTSDIISGITSIFSSNKQASEDNIVGTWTYDSPAIVFESDNLLSTAAAKYAANKLETKLQTTLSKYGISKGNFTITFKSDGTFSETLKKKTYKGKWAVKDQKLVLTYTSTYTGKSKSMNITTQKEGNNLLFVTDATKLLTLVQSMGAQNATNSSLSSILSLSKNIKGMKLGLQLVKK